MLFIIERGVCDACKLLNDQEAQVIDEVRPRNCQVVLAQLKKGACFGEMAVVFAALCMAFKRLEHSGHAANGLRTSCHTSHGHVPDP